jgi:hypothetical protein
MSSYIWLILMMMKPLEFFDEMTEPDGTIRAAYKD